MNVYAVVGTGTAKASVIQEGLRDALKEGDALALVWDDSDDGDDGINAVFDYVLENDIQFSMYYEEGDKVPRPFRESEHGVVQKVKNPSVRAINDITGNGKVLFMWDTADDDDQIDPVFDLIEGKGILVLELTNGLDPIKVVGDDEIPEPVDPDLKDVDPDEQPEAEVDETRFTKLELETMTAAAVKRYGKRIGATATTAKGIIAELFPDGDDDEKEVEKEPNMMAVVDLTVDSKVDAFLTHLFGDLYTSFSG